MIHLSFSLNIMTLKALVLIYELDKTFLEFVSDFTIWLSYWSRTVDLN